MHFKTSKWLMIYLGKKDKKSGFNLKTNFQVKKHFKKRNPKTTVSCVNWMRISGCVSRRP
jgi:hypothetical protein